MLIQPQLRFRIALAMFVCGISALTAAPPALANPAMRKELAKIAQNLKAILDDESKSEIAVGAFTGPSTFPTSAGPGISQMLTEELEKLGLKVKTPAEIGVEGKFLLSEVEEPDPNNSVRKQKRIALRIKGQLVDRFGRQLTNFNLNSEISDGEFKADVKSEEAVTGVLGIPSDLPADGTPEERTERLRESIIDPSSHIAEGSRVFANATSPYGIEILCDGAPLPCSLENKLPVCDIPLKSTYRIRIYNNSEYDAGVRVTIDGLSIFAFSELRHSEGPKKGEPLYDHYIIPAGKTVELVGWHRTNAQVDSFVVDDVAKAAAAALKRQLQQAKLGTITAQFFAAWPTDGLPPSDEPPAKKGTPRATGMGPPIQQAVAEVKRNIGVLRSTVSIRYDK